MKKLLFIILIIIFAKVSSAQIKHTQINSTVDSCLLLKKLLLKQWKFDKKSGFYLDSIGIFINSEKHPAFTSCLLGKTSTEIIILLGKPTHYYMKRMSYTNMDYGLENKLGLYLDLGETGKVQYIRIDLYRR